MVLTQGKRLTLCKEMAGKPRVVTVLSSDPEHEWLIKLQGDGRPFFMNKAMISHIYTDQGQQLALFRPARRMTDVWKVKHLKNATQ